MKKFFKSITIVTAAVASLISCNKETNPVDSIEKEYTYTFTLSNPDTKAYLDLSDATAKWESGDQLGVYADTPTGISYNRWGNITLSEPVKFQISSYKPLTVGSKIYCYFPYDAENSNGDAQNPTKVNLSIPTTQNGKMNAMPMVSVPYAMTKEVASQTNEPIDEINMRNLGGVFQFNIFSTNAEYQTETIEKVEFNANAALAGSFVYDITKEDLSEISGLSESTVIVEVQNLEIKANKDESSKVLMVVAPGSHSGSLVVTTDVAIYTLNFTSAKQIERSHVKPLNVDLNKAVSRELRPIDPTGEVTKTMSDVVSEKGYTVSSGSTINTIATEIVLDDVVTMSTTGEANCGSFWGTSPNIDWRLYQNKSGNIILSLAEGYKMTSVTFVYGTGNNGVLMYGTNTLSSGTAFTGIKGQTSATFDVSASSDTKGQIKLTSVTVAYTSGEIEKDDSGWLLEPKSVTVMVGNYEEVVYATDFDGDIDVSIDDDTVADVVLNTEEETITVTGKKIGNAVVTITATGSARFKDTEVTIPVEVIAKQKVDPDVTIATSATVEAEATVELDLKIDNNYDGTITVASAAEGTATASYANGKVIINGVAQGTTIVTVSAEATENFNAFSREITVTVTEASQSKAITFANGTFAETNSTITWNEGLFTLVQAKGNGSSYPASSNINAPRFYQGNTVTFTPASGVTIKKIIFVNESNYNGAYKYNGNNISSDGLTHTWTGSSTSAISFVMNAQARPTSITVYYTGSVIKTDATVTFDTESVTVGEGLTATVNITNNNFDKALSVSSNNENATASISGNVITVNGVSEGSATITVSGSGSDLYNDVSKTISVTVNATAKYSINIDGGITGGTVSADETTDIPAGATVTLTVTPETGKKLKTLTVTNASTSASIETTKTGETYTFTMPEANVNVTAEFETGSKTKKTATLTISSGVTSNCNIEDDMGNIWAVSSDGNYTSNKTFIQVGTNSAKVSYLKLSTSAYKDIEKVQVWGTSKASTNVTPKINIDGSNKGEGSVYTSQTSSSGGTEFSQEFSPRAEVSNTLEIEISRTSSAKGAIYFNKAIITYYE